jgi:hypothetical protein
VTVPGSVYTFVTGGAPLNVPVQITIPTIQISIERFQMPFPPIAAVVTLAGSVNQYTFQMTQVAFNPGTLLFLGGDISVDFDTLGNVTWHATYKLAFKFVGWNNALHPNGTSGWVPVQDGNGNGFYPIQDFSILP